MVKTAEAWYCSLPCIVSGKRARLEGTLYGSEYRGLIKGDLAWVAWNRGSGIVLGY